MVTKTKQKTWLYSYTFSIRFVGIMPKAQFIADVSELTCDFKNFIRARVSETFNVQDVVVVEKKPGQVVRITS